MKIIGKIFGIAFAVVWISVLILCIVSGVIILLQVSNYSTTVFNDTNYITIEELHYDYIEALEYAHFNGDSMTDYYPKELVSYFEDGENVIVLCTYSSDIDSEVKQDSILAYIAKKNIEGYYLEIPYMGISAIYMAIVPLHSNYDHFTYHYAYVEYKTLEEARCYGFAFKDSSASHTMLFDGVKMDEIECVNPFTGEEFILCYAASDKTYNVLESFMTPKDERHTLEIQ